MQPTPLQSAGDEMQRANVSRLIERNHDVDGGGCCLLFYFIIIFSLGVLLVVCSSYLSLSLYTPLFWPSCAVAIFSVCKLTTKVTISLSFPTLLSPSSISAECSRRSWTRSSHTILSSRTVCKKKKEAPPLMCSFLSAFNCRPHGHASCFAVAFVPFGITDTSPRTLCEHPTESCCCATSCPSARRADSFSSFSGSCRLICFGLLTSLLMDHRVRTSVSPSSQLVAVVGERLGHAMLQDAYNHSRSKESWETLGGGIFLREFTTSCGERERERDRSCYGWSSSSFFFYPSSPGCLVFPSISIPRIFRQHFSVK